MQFTINRDTLLSSLTHAQGVIEKKNTLPILSNVLMELKKGKFYNKLTKALDNINMRVSK